MKTSDHLYKRKGTQVWWAWYREGGVRIRKSTGVVARSAALKVLAGWERQAAEPGARGRAEATLGDAFEMLRLATLARATAKNATRSLDTVGFQTKQSRGWLLFAGLLLTGSVVDPEGISFARRQELRELGRGFPLARVDPGFVDSFVAWRRSHGQVSEGTLGKDLSVLRPAVRHALRAGKWAGSLEATFPRHELHVEAGERWLEAGELDALAPHLTPERFAVVAYAYAVGAEPRACERALRADIADPKAAWVRVRGTKRRTRDRTVQVLFPWQVELLASVRANAIGAGPLLFRASVWKNFRRELGRALDKAGLRPASLTACRHAFAHRMAGDGIRQADLAQLMGHADTKMLDRVYARATTPAELRKRCQASIAERAVALRVIEGGAAKAG